MRYSQVQAQRTKLLQKARKLARSGQHAQHLTIVSELEASGEFLEVERCLTNQIISGQLDKLCAMAQASAVVSLRPLSIVLAEMRAASSRGPKPAHLSARKLTASQMRAA
jgi:hypothetical protein